MQERKQVERKDRKNKRKEKNSYTIGLVDKILNI